MKAFFLVLAICSTTATAGSPFLAFDNRPFTEPKYPEWRFNTNGLRPVYIGHNFQDRPVNPLFPNILRDQNGNTFFTIAPLNDPVRTGYYWVR